MSSGTVIDPSATTRTFLKRCVLAIMTKAPRAGEVKTRLVPPLTLAEAANALAKRGDRIAIGPSDDGGYYLIGLKQLHRRMFEEIDWSTDRVFAQAVERAAEIGVGMKLLPRGYDVDDPAALRRLCAELLRRSPNVSVAPATQKFLSDLIEREGSTRICPV